MSTTVRARHRGGRTLLAAAAVAAIIGAAGGAESPPVAEPTVGGQSATDTDLPAPTSSDPGTAGSPDGVAYQSSAVTEAVAIAPDGSTFTPADFAGKTVFVETFATWCSKCRAQLGDTNQAAAQAGDRAVFLILSVETDLDPAV
ncbi:MAG: hypothetical protein R3249_08040, partial [Nitriliruptorales bacterium]|nr:hypothetical protein [Nitriliruptorales bacterium]